MLESMELADQRGRLCRLIGQAALILSLLAGPAAAAGEGVELISKAAPPAFTPSGPSSLGDLSADGRYVVFVSPANNLVPGQIDKPYGPGDFLSPGSLDVFLRDRATGKTTLVSRSSSSATTGGQIGNGDDDSILPAISADGRYVVFSSERRNLVSGQTGTGRDIFLYDRVLNTTKLVSHRPGSPQAGSDGSGTLGPPVLSADGRFVAYLSGGFVVNGVDRAAENIFLYDRLTAANTFVGKGGREVEMSADGRFIVYYNNDFRILLYDRISGTTTLVSHAAGSPLTPANDQSVSPKISADGSVVVFSSWATDLVAGQTDTHRTNDLFLYDRVSGQTVLLSRSAASTTTAANSESWEPSLSADGRWVAFYSTATNLVSGVTDTNNEYDIFLYDRLSGAMSLVSHANGLPTVAANDRSLFPRISADSGRIAFTSRATNLAPVPSGLGGWTSLFFHDRNASTNTFVEPMTTVGLPVPWFSLSLGPLISADGLAIAFGSYSELVTGDNNTDWDIYLYDEDGPPSGTAPFIPCTLLDTRRAGNGPALRSNVRRVLDAGRACAVPSAARSVAVNVTVLQATGKGNLRLYPGNVQNKPSATLRFQKGATRTGRFNLPLATNGAGTLGILPFVAGNGSVHVIVEITGYSE